MIKVVVFRLPKKAVYRKVGSCCEACRRKKNYTVAMCDDCHAVCDGSRQPNSRGGRAAMSAHQKSKEFGWAEDFVYDTRPGRKRYITTVKLVCPECQKKRRAN